MNLGLQRGGCKASRTMEELTHTDALGVASTLGFFFALAACGDNAFKDASLGGNTLDGPTGPGDIIFGVTKSVDHW
jgi:hypothetical protein